MTLNTSVMMHSSCQGDRSPTSLVWLLAYHSLQLQKLWELSFQRFAFNNLEEKRFRICITRKSLLGRISENKYEAQQYLEEGLKQNHLPNSAGFGKLHFKEIYCTKIVIYFQCTFDYDEHYAFFFFFLVIFFTLSKEIIAQVLILLFSVNC